MTAQAAAARLGGGALRFLASRDRLRELIARFIYSKPFGLSLEMFCLAAVRGGSWAGLTGEDLLAGLSRVRNFSEGTRVNVISEIHELADGRKIRWVMGRLGRQGSHRKARLLKKIFYNLVVLSLKRKIETMKKEGRTDALPNLSTLLLAPSARCNLSCRGCPSIFMNDLRDATFEQMDYVVDQAKKMNIFHVVVMGRGEPFIEGRAKDDLLRLIGKNPYLNFFVFTNGTTLDDEDVRRLARLDNLFIFVSVDGPEELHDARRGKGTFAAVLRLMGSLAERGVMFGYSATVTSGNYRSLLSMDFVSRMMRMGCLVGYHILFLAVSEKADAGMMLSMDQIREYGDLMRRINALVDIPLVDFELFEQVHGCRAKRGSMIYVDAVTGKVYPCPKTPFSAEGCNLYEKPHPDRLAEILSSDFYRNYRRSGEPCRPCWENFTGELDAFLGSPQISGRERRQLEILAGKLRGARDGRGSR